MPQAVSTFAQVRSSFLIDLTAMRFRDAKTGRFVSEREVKRAVNTVMEKSRLEIRSLTRQMTQGEITIGEWQSAMAASLKNLHLAATAVGKGGLDRMTRDDYGRVGAMLRFQYGKLEKFARGVESGKVSTIQALGRAEMYGLSGNVMYERIRRNTMETAGMTKERRVLGTADHCEDCVAAAARGWVDIGTLPEIGDSRCLTNCKCSFEYRRGA